MSEEEKDPSKGGRKVMLECTCKQIGGKHQCSCPVFNRLAVQRHRAKQAVMKGQADGTGD